MPLKYLILTVVLTVSVARPLMAQQVTVPAADRPALVHLDVTVLDASGQPVRDLAVSDFEVSANGTPVPVESVTVVHLPGRTAVAQVARGRTAPADVAHDVLRNDDIVDRYVAIVLDDIARRGSTPSATGWMSTAGLDLARAIVDRLGPDDRGTVFFSFMGRQQGLTSDRDRLRAAIDRYAARPVLPSDCQAGENLDGCLFTTLQHVADALPATAKQRKTVVVISESGGLPSVVPTAAGGEAVSLPQRALQRLQATNAAVYSITPASAPLPASADPRAVHLAAATGGRALVDSSTQAPVEALWADGGAYYLLALRPAAQLASGPITVRVGRPGMTSLARVGYVVGDVHAQAPQEGAAPLLERAMVAPHQVPALPMGVNVAVFAVPGRREAVVSVVAAVTSAAGAGAKAWQASVAATAFDTEWRPRASHRQTIEVTAPPAGGMQTVDVVSALELLPGRYEIRVAAESAGRAGSVFVDVDVPEFQSAPVSASGAVVTTAPRPYAASELLAKTLSVTPTTRRMFLRTEAADVLVRFYQGGRARLRSLPVSLRIADASGEGVIQGDEVIPAGQFDEGRSAEWRFTLPLGRLSPGEFLLTVEAELDGRRVTRHVRFSVMK